MSRNGKMKNIYEIENTLDFIDYANSIVSAMDSGFFKIVAHPDIFFVNDFLWDENCEKACDIIINGALERDFLLEFNANGLRRGMSSLKMVRVMLILMLNFLKSLVKQMLKL